MKAWEGVFTPPLPGRTRKPRKSGFTMVIDKGLGVEATRDLLDLAADYIDDVKLTFGTSAFYDRTVLERKIAVVREAGVDIMPGGTFLEVAIWQGTAPQFLDRAKALGFTMIEVSDGTIPFSLEERRRVIGQASERGFRVISEVGKKIAGDDVSNETIAAQIRSDLALGSFKVIVEAREAGRGTILYTDTGKVKEDEVAELLKMVPDPDVLVWEAPQKAQQEYFILRFGPNVNLGNVFPEDILALEALRNGLRGDTLKRAYDQARK